MINADKQFPAMMKRIEKIVRSAFPIESKKHVMNVMNLRWENHGNEIRDNITLHKDHKLKDKTLSADLIGDIVISTTGGKVVNRKSGMVLVTLPHITNRASYIVNGQEVQTVNQLRLRPGPYTRFTADDNTETFINAAGGGYKVIFNRQTGVIRLKSGTTFVYIYPILNALGVSDARMQDAWGSTIFEANKKYDKKEHVEKLFRVMRRYAEVPEDPAELGAAVDSFFRSKRLDPKISKITLKKEFDAITPEVLLRSSAKAVALAKGTTEMDDTESLAFKSVHSVEDFVPERLERAVPSIRTSIAGKMDRRPMVTSLISPDTFSGKVIDWFMTSEFTRYSDQQNPIDMASTSQLTTTMGEGGIRSMHAVTDQVRTVHPSQMGFLDPLHTPEGGKIGVTGHLTIGAEKKGDSLFIEVLKAKSGEKVKLSAQDLENAVVAFNDQYNLEKKRPKPLGPLVAARRKGRIEMVPPSEVQYVFKDPRSFFSVATNAIPFLHNNSPNRAQMADRHIEQAVPLTDPDAPMVQARFKGDVGYDDFFGKFSNVVSPATGVVSGVSVKLIKIKDANGKIHKVHLHHNYPLNGGAFLTDTSIVKTGDKVKKGQRIAENNFTKDGTLAVGKNLKTAFMPYKGQNFEDGIVISDNAARKLISEHKHEMRLDLTKNIRIGLDVWLAHFPDEAVKVDRGKYDTSGIIRSGAKVDRGDVLIPAVEQVQVHEEYDYARLHKSLRQPWRNVALTWESDYPGVVTDVVKSAKFVKVFIKTEEPAQVGDKLSNRAGGKGIIVNILPDNEMIRDKEGNPLDVLFNPGGVAGRVNPGQLYEGAVGKVAKKTGKKYLTDNFSDESSLEMVKENLKAEGLSDTETVHDPTTGHDLENINVGDIHFMKLQHQVRKKFSARGLGAYTSDEQPAKISGESAQNIGSGEIYALLASGSLHFLKDASTLKSQSNPEYWRAAQLGLPTPPPKSPFILDKFINSLEGAGINVKQEGSKLKALPMTDKDTASRSAGEIKSYDVVRASDLKPERGGLFDKATTGGYDGISWSHIDLETAMPNPLMERAIISVLGMKAAQFKSIMSGNLFVTSDGSITSDHSKGKAAGDGLRILLDKINVDRELEETISAIRAAKGAKLDELNKKRRFLSALKASKLRPSEAYIQSKVPVVPPKFRPIYPLPDGSLNVADPNHGYREILMINNQLKSLAKHGVDGKNLAPLRADLYGAFQGMTGMSEPLTRSKNFRGFVATVKGRVNKRGLFQGRVMKRPQDLSGRSTIIPDPKLGLDEMGIPLEMGLKIYKPFIIRKLVGMGFKPTEALDLIEKQDEKAVAALRAELKERPAYLNRAPTLHKFGIMPFEAKVVSGKAIRINPLIVRGYNADFDGDTMGVHVPVSEEARLEAFKKMPSKQLFAASDESVIHTPSKEYVLGLYLMTFPKGKKVKASSTADMMGKFQKGKIKVNTPVIISGKTWTPGQVLIGQAFPSDMQPGNVVVDKKEMNRLLNLAAKTHPKETGKIIDKLKDLGAHYVTAIGYSVGLDDLGFDYKKRDKILDDAAERSKKVGFDAAYGEAFERIGKEVRKGKKNRFVVGNIDSGAFGKGDMVSQMIATPVAVRDHKNEIIQVPIKRSFAEGHNITSYWATTPGARKGLIEKGLGTAETGALSKRLINTTIQQTISVTDCGTAEGILLAIESRDALDRVIASGPYKGQTVSPALVRRIKSRGVRNIAVRSPLKCRAQRGICAKCFGLLENGQFPPIGYHVGVLAGQAVSEPMTQLMLRTFHTGGAMSRKMVGFDRIRQIMEMPENVPGKATIAMTSGAVSSIKRAAGGGWIVMIGDVEHFIPKERGLAVKRGDRVIAGKQLSRTGVVKPQDLLAATGDINTVRNRMVKDFEDEFSQGGDANSSRRWCDR
jgi:DNA-directed RNA polymerase subunit beta'